MATTARGIVYPTVGTTLTPLANHFASLATSTNTALDNVDNGTYRTGGTDTQRTALTAPKLKEGLQFRTTDTDREWIYDGANWLSNEGGMYVIRPGIAPTVVGAGGSVAVDASGQINFTNVPAGGRINLDSIFTTRFNDYTLSCRYKFVTDGGFSLILRAGGVDRATNNYRYAIIRSDGGNSNGSGNPNIPVGGNVGSHFYSNIDIHDAMVNEATNYQIRTSRSNAAGTHSTEFNSGLYAVSGLDDGIAFQHTAGSGAVTGTIRIYGRP